MFIRYDPLNQLALLTGEIAQHGTQFGRERRLHADYITGDWMRESHHAQMQENAVGQQRLLARAVDAVADQRVAVPRKVDANLVQARGLGF